MGMCSSGKCQRTAAPNRKRCDLCRASTAKHRLKTREIVFDYYGDTCACCGETEPMFLQIDHTNNDGGQHRKRVGPGATNFYRDVIRQGFPDDLQILCANCNHGRMRNKGVCPHEGR